MSAIASASHILGHHSSSPENDCTWEFLWNWFGDREVFFCNKKGDVFSNSKEKMFECFQILHYVDGLVFWKLHPNCVKLGLVDPMGSFLDGNLNENEVGVLMTHNNDGEEIDVIEQWKTVSLDWWNINKYDLNIREKCQE